jgi:hypothetical protein
MSHSTRSTLGPVKWGEWELDRARLVLMHTAGYGYEVDLEDCTTSAQVLDWIMQIAGKNWGTRKCVGGLVEALNDLLRPQANLCSFGADKTLTRERIAELVSQNELDVRAQREMHRLEQGGEVPWREESSGHAGGLRLVNFGAWSDAHAKLVEQYRRARDGV